MNLNSLTVEKLGEAVQSVDDIDILLTAAKKETRASAKKLLEERIAVLQQQQSEVRTSSEDSTPTVSSSEAVETSLPPEEVPQVLPSMVVVKLTKALSYRGRGVSLHYGEVKAVDPLLARSLLESGLFEEVVQEERRE